MSWPNPCEVCGKEVEGNRWSLGYCFDDVGAGILHVCKDCKGADESTIKAVAERITLATDGFIPERYKKATR